jgi:hypothetical protein
VTKEQIERLTKLADYQAEVYLLKSDAEALKALLLEMEDLQLASAIDKSGADRALAQMEDAIGVMQLQQERARVAESCLSSVCRAGDRLRHWEENCHKDSCSFMLSWEDIDPCDCGLVASRIKWDEATKGIPRGEEGK